MPTRTDRYSANRVFAVLVVAFALLFSGLVRAVELTAAIEVYDPAYVSMPGNAIPPNMPGAELALINEAFAHEICRRISARCTLRYVAFGEILPGIEEGRFDLGFGNFLRTPEREKRVAFSDAVWRSSSRLVALRTKAELLTGKTGQAVSVDSLHGVRVVAVDGSQQQSFLKNIAGERGVTLVLAATPAGVFSALREDRADFALLSAITAYLLLQKDGTRQFEFAGPAVSDRGLGGSVHIALPKQRDELRRTVNQAIATIRADGTFQRIVRQYLPLGLD